MISVHSIAQRVQHPAGTTVVPLWLIVRIMLMEERFPRFCIKDVLCREIYHLKYNNW